MILNKHLKRVGLVREPPSKGYRVSSGGPWFCLRLTVTALDVKENGQIFIGTLSLEQCSAEQSVIVDVMYLSVYLVWQSPQVCWVLVSTGTSESEIYFYRLLVLLTNTHSQPQGDASFHTHTHRL